MNEITWTKQELEEFDRLVDDVSSRHQVVRIAARIDMDVFVKKHGKEKCDAMFKYLESK